MKHAPIVVLALMMCLFGSRSYLLAQVRVGTSAAAPTKDDNQGKKKDAGQDDGDEEPKAFEKVITADAKRSPGLITVYQVKKKWYFQIPRSEMGKDYLWVARLTTAPEFAARAGARSVMVSWQMRDHQILLRQKSDHITAAPDRPMAEEVHRNNEAPILYVFPVEAWAPNGDAIIEVDKFFLTESPELGAKDAVRGQSMDAKRTFLDTIRSFHRNVETEITATYNIGRISAPPASAERDPQGKDEPSSSDSRGVVTAVVHYSLIRLADQPMEPRLADDRIGYFRQEHLDFGREAEEEKVAKRFFISRWRLEKKEPGAAASDVAEPITYYIDPATPTEYIPFIKAGVAEWGKALETAGFRNAIRAIDVPDRKAEPDWSQEDVRHSMIQWLPSSVPNAQGATLTDPRSGEILNATVSIFYNVLDLVKNWYFIQASPLDSRAQKLPLPPSVMGPLVQYIVAHEIGHTLGLEHNFLASAEYPTAKLRDPQWVKTMGFTPSIMDYARFDYVAQPEDHIDPNDLIPRVGPYDVWAIHWGYAVIPHSGGPDGERVQLDLWAREQDRTPWLRFAYPNARYFDNRIEAEAVGDADPVESARLGLLNLQRVYNNLYNATTAGQGDTYAELSKVWNLIKGQYDTELKGAAAEVAGLHSVNHHVGQSGPIWNVIPKEEQERAFHFVSERYFRERPFFYQSDLMRFFAIDGGLESWAKSQQMLVRTYLNGGLLARLNEEQIVYGKNAYGVEDLLLGLRGAIWSELLVPGKVHLSPMRRNLELTYVDALDGYLNRAGDDSSFRLPFGADVLVATVWIAPVYRGELQELRKVVSGSIDRSATPGDRKHLEYLLLRIDRALTPIPTPIREVIHPVGVIPGPTSLNLEDGCGDAAFCPSAPSSPSQGSPMIP